MDIQYYRPIKVLIYRCVCYIIKFVTNALIMIVKQKMEYFVLSIYHKFKCTLNKLRETFLERRHKQGCDESTPI